MADSASFKFQVDMVEAAAKLRRTKEEIEQHVIPAVESLSISAHAHILRTVKDEFANDKFKREYYLGMGEYGKNAEKTGTKNPQIDESAKNVRWTKVSNGIWVVELDEKAKWLEEGRQETFMSWLLQQASPGSSPPKISKNGSTYRVIPFKQTVGKSDAPGTSPLFPELIRKQAKKQKISLTRIEYNEDGTPKTGILHKLDMKPAPGSSYERNPDLFSKPRTAQDAEKYNLRPHSGIYKLEGAVVTQRTFKTKKGKTKVARETVVFRVISSKHEAEGRWMYPEVKPLNAFGKAYDYAKEQWENILKEIDRKISGP